MKIMWFWVYFPQLLTFPCICADFVMISIWRSFGATKLRRGITKWDETMLHLKNFSLLMHRVDHVRSKLHCLHWRDCFLVEQTDEINSIKFKRLYTVELWRTLFYIIWNLITFGPDVLLRQIDVWCKHHRIIFRLISRLYLYEIYD